ncbi:hypothetical protein ASZ90_020131 [hydrocarbon metagenome]|uniref:Uncharacterized protein n=1 Tax=hydrocarbon metagenome TaxID=938273 RepID=A0A0W8E2F5_9ZZZZ
MGQMGGTGVPPQTPHQYPPHNNYGGDPPRGEYRPPQTRSRKSPVGIVALALILLTLMAGGVYVYKALNLGDKNQAQPTGGTSSVGQLLDSIKGGSGGVSPDFSKPETYLPAPGLRMNYYEMYMDGDEGPLELVSANIIPNAAVSDAAMFTDGDGITYGGVCHYFKKTDGSIAYIFDDDPSFSYPYLPSLVQPGRSWTHSSEYGDIVYVIKQVGASCTLDCGIIDNCVLVEEDNQIFGIREAAYYAPGLGLVLRQSIPDGANVYRLTSYQQIDVGEARAILSAHSVNHEQINSQLAGQ